MWAPPYSCLQGRPRAVRDWDKGLKTCSGSVAASHAPSKQAGGISPGENPGAGGDEAVPWLPGLWQRHRGATGVLG